MADYNFHNMDKLPEQKESDYNCPATLSTELFEELKKEVNEWTEK